MPQRPSICCNASCRHAAVCDATRGGDPALLDIRDVVERVGPFTEGDRLVQPDAPHRAAFAVLSGLAKTVDKGRIVAFHLPGELFALDVPRTQTHSASVVAVGRTWFCRFPRTATDALCEHSEAIATHLRSLRRRERTFARRVTEGSAAERVKAFLLELRDRRLRVEAAGSGFVPLPMSREDIGSYLGMSAATVTRMLAKLRSQGSIAIHTDGVDVLHEASLRG
jgi:CRP/FNR family transcriptional regulator